MMEEETTLEEAILRWKAKHKTWEHIQMAKEVNFAGQWWPIKCLDYNLQKFVNCERLILDSNKIEKIDGMKFLTNLTYLSMDLNKVRSLKPLLPLGKTLQILVLNCNLLKSTKGIKGFLKLEELQIANNCLTSWQDFNNLLACEHLTKLSMAGNKFNRNLPMHVWTYLASRRNPRLKLIDDVEILDIFPVGFYPHNTIETHNAALDSPYFDSPTAARSLIGSISSSKDEYQTAEDNIFDDKSTERNSSDYSDTDIQNNNDNFYSDQNNIDYDNDNYDYDSDDSYDYDKASYENNDNFDNDNYDY